MSELRCWLCGSSSVCVRVCVSVCGCECGCVCALYMCMNIHVNVWLCVCDMTARVNVCAVQARCVCGGPASSRSDRRIMGNRWLTLLICGLKLQTEFQESRRVINGARKVCVYVCVCGWVMPHTQPDHYMLTAGSPKHRTTGYTFIFHFTFQSFHAEWWQQQEDEY